MEKHNLVVAKQILGLYTTSTFISDTSALGVEIATVFNSIAFCILCTMLARLYGGKKIIKLRTGTEKNAAPLLQ
jgi:hypothetical protein